MKKILFITTIFLILNITFIFSCEIKVTPDKNEYKNGDTAIITLTLKQDHGKCIHEGEEPKISASGLELLGKTAYTKISSDTYQIKYKTTIKNATASFTAILECTKGGDKETITLKVS